MTPATPNPRQHAYTFHLKRLLGASYKLAPPQRPAFIRQHIQLGELAEMAVKSGDTRIPNVPAVFVERAFRDQLQEIVDKIENGQYSFGEPEGSGNVQCTATMEEEAKADAKPELSSDTAYQRAFDQFIGMESEGETGNRKEA